MAQTKKAKSGPKRKKAQRPGDGASLPVKSSAKSRRGNQGSGLDSLTRIIEHPLVAELVSVAAIAAVAAIADHNVKTRTGEGAKGSKKALKAAGKAAAAAMGKRLSAEVEEIRKVSKKKAG